MRCLLLVALPAIAACTSLAGAPSHPEGGTETYVAPDSVVAVLDGVQIVDGGLSALTRGPDGALWTVSDRGPNLEAAATAGQPAKRFALPAYAPLLSRVDTSGGALRLVDRRPIRTPRGRAASGLPPPAAGDVDVETALGPRGESLGTDPWGIDAEGLAFEGDDVWVAEEYRPSLWRLDAETFSVRQRWTPTPTEPVDRALPPVVAGRQPNLGFEGVTVHEGQVVAALQGPIATDETDPATPITRLLRLDPTSARAETFGYPMDGPARKVGDLASLPDGRLLVLEHGPGPAGDWTGHVYAVRLGTPLGDALPEAYADPAAARAAGIPVLHKALVLDLVVAGWPPALVKPEGLAVTPDGRLAVIADNDYGVDAPGEDGRPVATGSRSTLVVFDAAGRQDR